MISTQYINLNMVPSGVMPVLHCSQYDVGRPLGVVIYNGSESVDLSGYTVTIEGTRTDRTPVTAGVTTDGNIGVFTTTPTMTNENDTYRAKVVLTDNAGRVSSLAFVMCVDEKTMDENAEEIEEDASLYQQYTGTVQTIIAQIRGDLAAEITARQNAISAEASARQAADNTLQSNINAEASTRATQDASLQSQINQLIAPSGSAPSAAEVENARIGSDGTVYPTLGDAIRTQNSLLKSQLLNNVAPQLTWVNGDISASHGAISPYTTRLTCGTYLDVCDCSVPDTAHLRIAVYGDYYAFLGLYVFDSVHGTFGQRASREEILTAFPGAKYIRLVFVPSSEGTISPADIVNYNVVVSLPRYIEPIKELYDRVNILYYGEVAQGGFASSGLDDGGNALRLRLPIYIPVTPGEKYEIKVVPAATVTRSINISASYFAVGDYITPRTSYTNFAELDDNKMVYTIPDGVNYFRVLLGYVGNAAINAADIDRVEISKVIEEEPTPVIVPDGYVVGADLLKAGTYSEKIGTISQLQSFCVYEGNYYSTDGSNLTKQDSSFAVLSTASVSLGHGNSLQLGSNGKAYSSGWNDNKVYIVDLATMTVDGSISLPTSGYTTAVIDDIKGLAYIFQRDTYPTTEEQYTFIVYDYVNQQTIKTTKTAPFAALQSCDLYNDRIMVVNGGGTSAMPNGYRVYDTSGNVLADYTLPTFSTLEPEGVCIDRDTGVLMLSFNTKDLYTITRL